MRHLLLILIILPISLLAQSLVETTQVGTNSGLPAVRINSVCTDDAGRLWIATNEGLYTYNGYQVNLFGENPQKESSRGE